MKKNISVIRCDRCGKRIHEYRYYIIEAKYNLGDSLCQRYELCNECMKNFLKELEYKNKMENIWDNISEERLIEE